MKNLTTFQTALRKLLSDLSFNPAHIDALMPQAKDLISTILSHDQFYTAVQTNSWAVELSKICGAPYYVPFALPTDEPDHVQELLKSCTHGLTLESADPTGLDLTLARAFVVLVQINNV